MGSVKLYGCYDFNREWYLIEMLLDIAASNIDWGSFTVPEENVDRNDWQCAYLEQYLDETGTRRICDTYGVPHDNISSCRVVFFIYKSGATVLRTPYGDFELSSAGAVPKRLKRIIEFRGAD